MSSVAPEKHLETPELQPAGSVSTGMPQATVPTKPLFLGKRYKAWRQGLSKQLFANLLASPKGCQLIKFYRVVSHPVQYIWRKQLVKAITSATAPIQVPREKGYALFNAQELPGFEGIRELTQQLYTERHAQLDKIQAEYQAINQKKFMVNLLYDEDLAQYPELIEFALSDPLLNAASLYLGQVPVLRRMALILSINNGEEKPASSQLFHQDGEDFQQLKLFINLQDITEAHGPFSFLPADVTQRAVQGYRAQHSSPPENWRYPDEDLLAHCQPSDVVQATGPAGQALLVDTSRCMHYGSRLQPGYSRLMLMVQFLCYHNLTDTKFSQINPKLFANDPKRHLAVTPRTFPRRSYYVNPLKA